MPYKVTERTSATIQVVKPGWSVLVNNLRLTPLLQLQQHPAQVFQQVLEVEQKSRRVGAIYDTMIEAQGDVHEFPRHDLRALTGRCLAAGGHADDGNPVAS